MLEVLRRVMQRRRIAYHAVFGKRTPAVDFVLADLRKFCRATVSTTVVSRVTGAVDPIASAQAEGRREVWLHITQHINLSDADIYKLVNRDDDESNLTSD